MDVAHLLSIPHSQLPLCQRLCWGSKFILGIYGSVRWLCPLWPPLLHGDQLHHGDGRLPGLGYLSKLKPCWLDPKGRPQGQICTIMA